MAYWARRTGTHTCSHSVGLGLRSLAARRARVATIRRNVPTAQGPVLSEVIAGTVVLSTDECVRERERGGAMRPRARSCHTSAARASAVAAN